MNGGGHVRDSWKPASLWCAHRHRHGHRHRHRAAKATLLPGTTEKDSTPPALPVDPPLATTPFAGGVRWGAKHGAYGLDFVSQDGTLRTKKSWYFTRDAVICLGAGITDTSGAHVRTTIENRNLGENGTAALVAEGLPCSIALGRNTVLPHASWLHLDGIAGYVLLDSAPLTVLREDPSIW